MRHGRHIRACSPPPPRRPRFRCMTEPHMSGTCWLSSGRGKPLDDLIHHTVASGADGHGNVSSCTRASSPHPRGASSNVSPPTPLSTCYRPACRPLHALTPRKESRSQESLAAIDTAIAVVSLRDCRRSSSAWWVWWWGSLPHGLSLFVNTLPSWGKFPIGVHYDLRACSRSTFRHRQSACRLASAVDSNVV